MTWFAQRNAIKETEEFSLQGGLVVSINIQQGRNLGQMVNLNNASAGNTYKATSLASVVVALQACETPLFVLLGLADTLAYLSNTASPVPVILAALLAIALGLGHLEIFKFGSVPGQKTWNAAVTRFVHMKRDRNRLATSALAKVLSLVFFYPLVNALVIGFVVTLGIFAAWTGSELTKTSSFAVRIVPHKLESYSNKMKRSSKSDELQETRPGDAEGNLQPSQKYTSGRFIDYLGSLSLLNNRNQRPTLQAKRDEIVSARRNAGKRVRSFQFIGAQVVVDQYAPTGSLYGLNTKQENFAFYSSTLKRYQFGFTGFKEVYNSDDRSGQYLWAGNIIVSNPRYNFRLTNIPTLS